MNCTIAINQLTACIFASQYEDAKGANSLKSSSLSDAVIDHVVTCPTCQHELENLVDSLTERPEHIQRLLRQFRFHSNELNADDLERLAAYVDRQARGLDAALLDPHIHEQIQSRTALRQQYELLIETKEAEEEGAFGSPIVYPSFGQQRQQEAQNQREMTGVSFIWRHVNETLYELNDELSIRISHTRTVFDELSTSLNAHLMPVPALAMRDQTSKDTELHAPNQLLELPHPEANLVIRLNIEPVMDGQGDLILEICSLSPSAPLEQVKVTLRDEDENLLESTSTDQNGLATFGDLESGKYTVLVEHESHRWHLTVTLKE
ncbi:hypothetical protein KFU94_04540 [Chloroflexi bacterium TSY]|nr:hypothetical protein [Chloroflexi bacterium TSY]